MFFYVLFFFILTTCILVGWFEFGLRMFIMLKYLNLLTQKFGLYQEVKGF